MDNTMHDRNDGAWIERMLPEESIKPDAGVVRDDVACAPDYPTTRDVDIKYIEFDGRTADIDGHQRRRVHGQCCQRQPVISGISSPSSRIQAVWAASRSFMACSISSRLASRAGTRRATSITR